MTEFSDNDIENLGAVIGSTAYSISHQFAGYVDAVDIQQALWEWTMRNKKKIRRWAEENDEKGYDRVLGFTLRDVGTHFARQAKADKLGYKLGDEFYYTKGMLSTLLPSVYDENAWINPPRELTGGRSGKALNEGFGWVATLSDVSRALSLLAAEDQRLLYRAFAEGNTRNQLAEEYDLTRRGFDLRVEAAVKRLWHKLGGPKWLSRAEDRADDPDDTEHMWRGRKSVSNAQARAITEDQWNPS